MQKLNNGAVLVNYTDKLDGEKKFAMYRKDHVESVKTNVEVGIKRPF